MTKVKSIILAGLTVLSISQGHAQFGKGLAFDMKEKRGSVINTSSLGFSAQVPTSYSLKMYAPYVKNQGIYPSCAGWAVSYEALSIQYAVAAGLTNRNHITAKAFCPYYSYNKAHPGDLSCNTGTNFYPIMETLMNEGGKKFYLPLLGCGTALTDEFSYASKNYKIETFGRVKNVEVNMWGDPNDMKSVFKRYFDTIHPMDVNVMKYFVANKMPVVIGMFLPNSFYTAGKLWEPTAEEKADPASAIVSNTGAHSAHAMTVIGFDDSKYGGAFEVMNSWSEGWGDEGFTWIKYDDFKMYVYQAWVMQLFHTSEDLPIKTGVVWGDCYNGHGLYRFENGQTYEGQFKEGKFNGYGVYTWPNGMAYAGQWKDDKKDGEATFYFKGGTYGQSTWLNDKFISGYDEWTYSNGDTYKGYIVNDVPEGYGVYTFASGARYVGMFSNGMVHGLAKYYGIDGSSFIGIYTENKRNGKGLFVSSGGKITAGDWVYDKFQSGKTYGFATGMSPKANSAMTSAMYLSADCESGNCLTGEGKRVTPDGCVYTGTFLDGLEDGKGKKVYTNATYEGTWKQGHSHGVGILAFNAGGTEMAEFKNGKEDGYVLWYDNAGAMAVYLVKDGVMIAQIKENVAPSASPSAKIPTSLTAIPDKITSKKK